MADDEQLDIREGFGGSPQLHLHSGEQLKALAHPVRSRLLWAFVDLGEANVTSLAEAVGEPANSVSYHLGILERAGMTARAEPPVGATRRETWWRLRAEGISFHAAEADDPVMARAAARHVNEQMTAMFAERLRRLDMNDREGAVTWTPEGSAWLTDEQAERLRLRLLTVLDEWFAAEQALGGNETRRGPEGTHLYRYGIVFFSDDTGLPLTRRAPDRDLVTGRWHDAEGEAPPPR